ncbi:hypothetical protein M408DRAFT_326270 [Serendipita vermifera MAFF 305830]|uniref:BTB domain-containing protein n=1 Tax=Serendipita vermifera MAFF 305830 TaxID=933852 RepID=A0A0C3B9U3_SERVB|nr:hypothetical protein M408DRAFT_326270 [Serendipita vermifera MAFF 305830]
MATTIDEHDFDAADVPLSSTLYSPVSPFGGASGKPLHLQDETGVSGGVQESETTQQVTPIVTMQPPTPTYKHHPKHYYDDGTLFVLVDDCLFRVHMYHFLTDNGNVISNELELTRHQVSEGHPVVLPKDVKVSSFENLLGIVYRRPLDTRQVPTRTLKDACLTANALGLASICNQIAKYLIEMDCPDESLDEAVPKHTLAIKLPDLFPKHFKEAQVDKLCCAAAYMTHSHFYELGFTELGKIWKAALVARAGYDGQKTETYEPPAELARASYLIKVKNMPGYRAIRKELFG